MLRFKMTPGFARIAAACAALSLGSSVYAQAPVITITPPSVVISYVPGAGTPAAQQVLVMSDVAAQLQSYSVSYTQGAAGWLTVFPPSGSVIPALQAGSNLSLFTNDSVVPNLPAGQYVAVISLNVLPAPAQVPTISVFLAISGGGGGGGGTNQETITTDPATLTFNFQPGSAVPAAVPVAVTTSDNANITAQAVTDDGGTWLAVSPASSITPGSINVSVNPGTMSVGTYTGNVTIRGSNNVAQIPVTFTIGSSGLTANPASITINEPQNFGPSAPQPLTITASGAAQLAISTTADGNWLQVDVANATAPATLNVRANDSGLPQGTYSGMVNIQSGPTTSVQVPVTLNVGPPATLSLSPGSVVFTYQINDPAPVTQSARINTLTGAAQTFSVAPVTNDGGKWLNATASPSTTPGSVVIGIAPAGLTAGTYSGVVNVTSSLANSSPEPILVTLIVKPAPTPTVLSVNSAASYATGAVAPGELVTIFGSAIGPASIAIAPAGTAPASLGGTSVSFDGIPAPIYYVSSGQSTVQVPYNIVLGQTLLKITYNGVSSVGTSIPSVSAFPGLFTMNQTGQGQIAALNSDFTVNSPSNPAARGTYVFLYGTGEGQTAPASVEGARVPIIVPYPQTPYPVLVSIGGQITTTNYTGETPGSLSGLMQINALVPPNAPTGPSVPVTVSINGRTTQNNITIAVK